MSELSEHTELINYCLSFIRESGSWPTPLDNAGYSLESVLPDLINSNGNPIKPDLVLSSDFKQNVLVVDCSGDEIDIQKLNDMKALEVSDLLREITQLDPSSLSREVTVFGNSDTGNWIDNSQTDVPSIIIRSDRYERLNDFDDDSLNNNLSNGRLPSMKPPVSYFPFGPEDSRERIAHFISQELMKQASNGESNSVDVDVVELLKETFDCWESITDEQQEELRRKVVDILDLFSQKDVEGNMKKVNQKTYYVNSCNALQRKFEETIDELSENERTLSDFLGL